MSSITVRISKAEEINPEERPPLLGEEKERDELDFIIQKKLEHIQKLNGLIEQLEEKVQELRAERKQGEAATKSCPEQPTMKDLLVYCSTLKDSVSGKLTPDKKTIQ